MVTRKRHYWQLAGELLWFSSETFMKVVPVVALFCLALAGCSQSQDDHAHAEAERTREQMRQTGEQLRQDIRPALKHAEADTARASKDLDRGLETTRDKVRKALDAPTAGDQNR